MYIDDECIGCGICTESCPVEAISLVDDKAVIDPEICTGCGLCADVCPMEAIHEGDGCQQSA